MLGRSNLGFRRVNFHRCSVARFQIVRLFQASARTLNNDEEERVFLDPDSRFQKVTVTKKKFSELPSHHVLSDGGRATPIDNWAGGLDLAERRHKKAGTNLHMFRIFSSSL
jgi:hypothetical protein